MKKKNVWKMKPEMKLFWAAFPFLIIYFLFSYLPLDGWRYAFYNYKPGYKLSDCEFVGLKHFTSMFANPVMRRETIRVLRNTCAMSMLGIITSFVPMLFAIFLNELKPMYKKVVQTITTVPNFVSWVLVYSLATAVFAPESGALNIILRELKIIEQPLNVLANSEHVWLTMTMFGMWKSLGWSAVVYLAGLSSIDHELYSAAAIDGAGRFQKMRYVTIPGLMPTYLTLLIMSLGSFLSNGMDQYYVFQNAFNKASIEVLDLYTYNLGIGSNNISYSTAVGITKSVVGLLLLFIVNFFSGKIREEKIF